MNNITKVHWTLNNYCSSNCSYCPIKFRSDSSPPEILKYFEVTKKIIDHYKSLGRTIDWTFNGGEPLEMFDFPMILKLCKEEAGTIHLHTNGGKLWMDWWAIEPYIDTLHLSYHYWQNPNLIKFILQTFRKKEKFVDLMVPIRPDYFEEDLARALELESEFNICVSKTVLYKEADPMIGMFNYTQEQLRIVRGEVLVQEQQHLKETTFAQRNEERVISNPSYTGQLCNTGIECLYISGDGWASGSVCNNTHIGNIWHDNFSLPSSPTPCKMMACVHGSDQQITKFAT